MARSGSRTSTVALLLLLGHAPAAAAQSLWSARSGSLVTDLRASRAGDLVTILVDEQSRADKSAETSLGREADWSTAVAGFEGTNPNFLQHLDFALKAAGKGKSDYDGTGSTTRSDRASAQITAKVMRVLDNGNLLIEGRRIVVVQNEAQTIVVSGVIRPYDVQPDNTVRSSALADGEIRLEGRGQISDRQRPGILQRLFDWLGLY